jgi:hypothetical protein
MRTYYVDEFYDGYRDMWGVFRDGELITEFFYERDAASYCDQLNENDY